MYTQAPAASINIIIDGGRHYEPCWPNRHVQKRLSKVLDWAAPLVVGTRGTSIPLHLPAKLLSRVFGPKGNELGDYLRSKLLVPVSKHYSTVTHTSKTYRLRAHGFDELSQRLIPIAPAASINIIIDGGRQTALTPVQRLEQLHAEELQAQTFKMIKKAERLWHPLQNLRRTDKPAFWQKHGLPFDYDISACAPTILMQLAIRGGYPPILVEGIQRYVDHKGAFREHVAALTGLSPADSKRLINSLFNGARLAKSEQCSAFMLLGADSQAMDRLTNDPAVRQLRASIKRCWQFIEKLLASELRSAVSLKRSKDKWAVYFRYEALVLRAIIIELDRQQVHYFTEHDGFRTNRAVDVGLLEEAVRAATGFELVISKNSAVQPQ